MDVRLVPPALAAWIGAGFSWGWLSSLAAPSNRYETSMTVAILVVVVGASVLCLVWARPTLFASAAACVVAVLSASLHVAAQAPPEIQREWHHEVRVIAHVTGPTSTNMSGVHVPIRTRSVHGLANTVIEVPLILGISRDDTMDDARPPHWKPGLTLAVTGYLTPARSGAQTAGYLTVTTTENIQTIQRPGPIQAFAHEMKQSLHRSLPTHPIEGSSLVTGLVVGDESDMPAPLIEDMRQSGLSHLTAVSGGNIAIVVGAVFGLAWLLRLPKSARLASAAGALGFYVIVVGPEPSVLRASVMGFAVLVALIAGGRRSGPSLLALAVLVLVIVNPAISSSWAFALSVAATGGILLGVHLAGVANRNPSMTGRITKSVILALVVTVAAQIATAPVLLAMGASVGIASVPANVVAAPAVPFVTILGLCAAVVSSVPGLMLVAQGVGWLAAWSAQWIAEVANAASSTNLPRLSGTTLNTVVAAVVVASLLVAITSRARVRLTLAAAASVFAIVGIGILRPSIWHSWPPDDWVVVQCDVGQGDALVLTGNSGPAIVVDVGPSPRKIDQCLTELQVDQIAAIILTHFHVDHVGGLEGALHDREVSAVYATPWDEPRGNVDAVTEVLTGRGITLKHLVAGDRLTWGGGYARVLWPRRTMTPKGNSDGSSENNASVVLDARVLDLRILLAGDIEPPAQAALMAEPGGFDVVKVPHHGSRYVYPRFTDWADAQTALISVGQSNRFGHPAASTLEAWLSRGSQIFRTDVHGDIAVIRLQEGDTWRTIPRTCC